MRRVLVYRIRKEFGFEAGHVLVGLRPDHPCSTPHGHSYRVVVEATGVEVDEAGFLFDFNLIKSVKDQLDHTFLNAGWHQEGWKRSPLPLQLNPTAENLARWIYERLNAILLQLDAHEDVKIEKVGVYETSTSYAEVLAMDLEGESAQEEARRVRP